MSDTLTTREQVVSWLKAVQKRQQEWQDAVLRRYTIDDFNTLIYEGERQFAEGLWQDSEDMFRELENEYK